MNPPYPDTIGKIDITVATAIELLTGAYEAKRSAEATIARQGEAIIKTLQPIFDEAIAAHDAIHRYKLHKTRFSIAVDDEQFKLKIETLLLLDGKREPTEDFDEDTKTFFDVFRAALTRLLNEHGIDWKINEMNIPIEYLHP